MMSASKGDNLGLLSGDLLGEEDVLQVTVGDHDEVHAALDKISSAKVIDRHHRKIDENDGRTLAGLASMMK